MVCNRSYSSLLNPLDLCHSQEGIASLKELLIQIVSEWQDAVPFYGRVIFQCIYIGPITFEFKVQNK